MLGLFLGIILGIFLSLLYFSWEIHSCFETVRKQNHELLILKQDLEVERMKNKELKQKLNWRGLND